MRASFEGDPEPGYKAICYDPLTGAALELLETRAIVNELFEFSRP